MTAVLWIYGIGAAITAVLILFASFYNWRTTQPRPRIRWQQHASFVAASLLWPLFWPYALGRRKS